MSLQVCLFNEPGLHFVKSPETDLNINSEKRKKRLKKPGLGSEKDSAQTVIFQKLHNNCSLAWLTPPSVCEWMGECEAICKALWWSLGLWKRYINVVHLPFCRNWVVTSLSVNVISDRLVSIGMKAFKVKITS